jgi:hypothetical protein
MKLSTSKTILESLHILITCKLYEMEDKTEFTELSPKVKEEIKQQLCDLKYKVSEELKEIDETKNKMKDEMHKKRLRDLFPFHTQR